MELLRTDRLLLPLSDSDGMTGLVEVGWHLHPQYQGNGIATESARAVLAVAGKAGIDEVLAIIEPDNVASHSGSPSAWA